MELDGAQGTVATGDGMRIMALIFGRMVEIPPNRGSRPTAELGECKAPATLSPFPANVNARESDRDGRSGHRSSASNRNPRLAPMPLVGADVPRCTPCTPGRDE